MATAGAQIFDPTAATAQIPDTYGIPSSKRSRMMFGRAGLQIMVGFVLSITEYCTGIDTALAAAEQATRWYHMGWDYKGQWKEMGRKYHDPNFHKAVQKTVLRLLAKHFRDLNWLLDFGASMRLINM